VKDERLVSKMEGRTNYSRRLKQFDGLTCLTLTPVIYDRSTGLVFAVWYAGGRSEADDVG